MKIRLCPLLFWVVTAFVWSYCAKAILQCFDIDTVG